MKNTLNHNSFSSVKISLHRFQNNIAHRTQKKLEAIKTSEIIKMHLIYFTSTMSIILLLAFIELNNSDNFIKILIGLVVLLGNFLFLKKNNL